MSDGSLPAPGGYVELPSGILWIRLPIPGGLEHINVWLLPAARGWWLVDTGMKTAQVRNDWQALERRLPLRTELRAIVVTHHHPDHFGMARWLSERHEVPVLMTQPALAAATRSLEPAVAEEASPPSAGFVERSGLEPDEEMWRILRGGSYRAIVSGSVQAGRLDPGGSLEGADGPWRLSVHEGHAPGHACLFHAGSNVLVSGDQLLPSISSNVSLYPSNEHQDPLGQYLESLEELCKLPEDTRVLPSHGRPFAWLHRRAAQLCREHHGRLATVHRFLERPASTHEVAQRLFRLRRLDALNRLLAMTETLAHLRWLELRGRVSRSGAGAGLRWHASTGEPCPAALREH